MDFGSISHELQEKTDAELAGILPAITKRDIKKVDAKNWLATTEKTPGEPLAQRDALEPGAAYVGSLVDLAKSETLPPGMTQPQFDGLKKGLKRFFGYLLEESPTLTTSSVSGPEPLPERYFKLLNTLVSIGEITQEQRDEFYALGGGRPYADETEPTIAAARQKFDDNEKFDDDYNLIDEQFLQLPIETKNRALLITALRNAADHLEAS